MTRLTLTASTLLLAALSGACSQSPQQSSTHDSDVKSITADVLRWKSDFNTRDMDKLLSHYADDTVVVIPGAPAARDAESRRGLIKAMIGDPALNMTSLECPRVEVAAAGDYGYAQCSYAMTVTDPVTKKPMNDKGNVIEVYRKQPDGVWKSISDTAVSEVSPVPPLPAAPPNANK